MSQAPAPNTSANAGDERTLSNPNSPEAIARRAQQSQSQASEDQRYDAPGPIKSGFQDYIIVWEDDQKRSREISAGVFLALATLLFLFKAAPDSRM